MAIDYIKRAIRLKPELAEGFYLLGRIYETSDKVKAAKYYKHFLKTAAADPEFQSKVRTARKRMGLLSNATKSKL